MLAHIISTTVELPLSDHICDEVRASQLAQAEKG